MAPWLQKTLVLTLMLSYQTAASNTKNHDYAVPNTINTGDVPNAVETRGTSNPLCDLDCQNGGYCAFEKDEIKREENEMLITNEGVEYYSKTCTCRPGYDGDLCENEAEECAPPFYKCHNGAPCEKKEGSKKLFCDCSHADEISSMAGNMCRKPVTRTCETVDQNNKSFCTNGGICLSSMSTFAKTLKFTEVMTHQGCKCGSEFEGDHCEYLKDMPVSSLAEPGTSSGVNAGIVIGFVMLVIAVVAGIAMLVHQQYEHYVARERTIAEAKKVYLNSISKDIMEIDDDTVQVNEDDATSTVLEVEELETGLEEIEAGVESSFV